MQKEKGKMYAEVANICGECEEEKINLGQFPVKPQTAKVWPQGIVSAQLG